MAKRRPRRLAAAMLFYVVVALMTACTGSEVPEETPQAEQAPADAPNLLHYDGDLYTYESGRASDPEPECLSLPERATEVGVVGPISSDDSASVASVEAEGEGASVYELEKGAVPDLYVHTGGDCWAYYFVGPG